MRENEIITLSHGAGGKIARELINDYIKKFFNCPELNKLEDGAIIKTNSKKAVLTTDSFVIYPIFFSGGDIGKLSICGTVNDLSAMGAKPLYLTCGFILEEGFLLSDFKKILQSMKKTAKEADIKIVAGDTKVVPKSKGDGIYINTTGYGELLDEKICISAYNAKPDDSVIITGNIGDHEIAILKEREGLKFDAKVKSDCAPLNQLVKELITAKIKIKAMRDPTRGGIAGVLNEIAQSSRVDILIDENSLPVNKVVLSACSIMGFEPLYLANEGKMIIILESDDAQRALKVIRKNKYGRNAKIIGKVIKGKGLVKLKTKTGGVRILLQPQGEQLPRIC